MTQGYSCIRYYNIMICSRIKRSPLNNGLQKKFSSMLLNNHFEGSETLLRIHSEHIVASRQCTDVYPLPCGKVVKSQYHPSHHINHLQVALLPIHTLYHNIRQYPRSRLSSDRSHKRCFRRCAPAR